MKTINQEIIASIIARRELAVDFLQRHNRDLSALNPSNLKSSDNDSDRQVFGIFGDDPNWKEHLTAMATYEIPNLWQPVEPESLKLRDEPLKPAPAGPGDESRQKDIIKPAPAANGQWDFQFDVDYFFTLIPHYSDGQVLVGARAFAVIDSQLTTQPDEFDSDSIPFNYETPKADAISGNFDLVNPKELALYQANDIISLDEMDISSVKEYKNLYKQQTDFRTKSQTCNLLNIPGKDQIVTVLLNGTQIGFEVSYFKDKAKMVWGSSPLYNHGIGFPNIAGFNISVSEVLPNHTIEVLAVVTKYDNPQHTNPTGFQTNLIKMVIDIPSKTFTLAANQKLVGMTPTIYFIMMNMEHQIWQSNGLVYLTWLSGENTQSVSVFSWDGTTFNKIWNEDFRISVPGFWYTYQAPWLYQHGDVFYFVHVYQNGNAKWPFYVECYHRQTDGTLLKTKTISYISSGLNAIGNFWSGLFAQNSLYLIQTTFVHSGGSNLNPAICSYRIDETTNVWIELNRQMTPYGFSGMPLLALSHYDIKAQPPKLSTLTESLQAIAILDSPPVSSLIDYSKGANYPSLTYSFQQQQSSSKNVETKTDYTKSESLEAGLKIFGISIGAGISKKMTDSADVAHKTEFKITQNTQIACQVQDMTVFLGMSFDIYEYPITIAGVPSGHFLFVVPTSTPHLIINTGQLMFRKTPHETGNLLSYPAVGPDDVQQMLYTNEMNINANTSFISTLDYSDLETTSESITTSTTVNKSLSLGIEFPIIKSVAASLKAKLEEGYTNTDITLTSFTIANSFTLKVQLPKLQEHDANKSFSIEPYFYIDKSNILRCAYRVDVPSGGPTDPTYWKEFYKYPDFGMVMPFHSEPFKDDSKYLLSFDIETNPRELGKDLKDMEISVTVHNWSLESGTQVVVGFYYMKEFRKNPSKADLIEIGRQTIPIIKPRGAEKVSVKWQNPYLIQPINAVPLYVIIDPDNAQQEISKDNNFAQMNYPITSLNAGEGIEQFLPE